MSLLFHCPIWAVSPQSSFDLHDRRSAAGAGFIRFGRPLSFFFSYDPACFLGFPPSFLLCVACHGSQREEGSRARRIFSLFPCCSFSNPLLVLDLTFVSSMPPSAIVIRYCRFGIAPLGQCVQESNF